MSKTSIATSSGSKCGVAARRVSGGRTKAAQEGAAPTIEDPKPAGARFEARVTKQDRMLTLLSRSEGASIEEMIRATSWQQHSVRGFLAGTVKKKLGFLVSSFKTEGDVRRYHIDKPRGR